MSEVDMSAMKRQPVMAVVPLFGTPELPKVDETIIELLGDMFDRALRGELVAVGVVAVMQNDDILHTFRGSDKIFQLLGAVDRLGHAMNRSMDEACDND